jgi:hypothetical protein
MIKNIGIYGNSIAGYNGQQPDHFITLLKEYFNANIVHSGITQCSEERILFNLKKTKKLDLAVVFHSPPYNIFVPSWDRDITSVDRTTLNKKISTKQWMKSCVGVEPNTVEKLFDSIPNGACWQVLSHFNISFENYSEAFEKWAEGDSTEIKELVTIYARSKHQDAEYYKGLFDALELSKTYLSHPDLQMNRYYGAMIQIDQYLKHKNIPCVHFLDKEKWYPVWAKIESGPVDHDLTIINKENSKYFVGYNKSSNALSSDGNKLIFDRILELLKISNEVLIND